MRKKHCFSLLLLLCILLSLDCQAKQAEQIELYVYFTASGDNMADLPLINDKVNQYLADKMDVTVHLVMTKRSYNAAVHNALLQGKQVDIAFCSSPEYISEWISNGWLHQLDDLLKAYGGGISSWIEDAYMYRQNGVIYGIGNNVERGHSTGFEYLIDVAEKYHLDMDSVHTFEDLTDIFESLHQQTSDIVPTVIHPTYIHPEDQLGNNQYGVLLKHESQTVTNLFESDEYWALLNLAYQWNQRGYLYDRYNDYNSLLYYMRSGKIFGALCTGKSGFAAQESFLTGQRIGYIELVPYALYSRAVNRTYCYVIPTTSADPVTAMKLLDLLYNDAYLSNLLIYGIEGVHYDRVGSHAVKKRADSQYAGINGYMYCNQYTAFTFDGASESLWQEMMEADAHAPKTYGYGFLFDDTNVKEKIVRCDAVYETYRDLLFSGFIDPQTLREEFLSAMQAAGIDDIIAEKQRQFAAFLNAKD